MEAEFWQQRWRTGQVGFHQSDVDRNLRRHWPSLGVAPPGRVFVPLCGKSLDLKWLLDRGHDVVGIELSTIAVQAFCMENGIPARRRVLADFDVYEAPHITLLCGDFFKLTEEILGAVAAVYDRAALIAWAPELRAPYVRHLSALTRSATHTLLVTVEYPQDQMPGPPFSVDAAEVEQLYARDYSIRELSREDVLANEARMQSRGVTQCDEVGYLLTRL